MGLCPSPQKARRFYCDLWLLWRMVLPPRLSFVYFVCRLCCCPFCLLLSLIVCCRLVFVVVVILLSSGTMHAWSLRLDSGETVAYSCGDGGAGPFWSSWESGLLGASMAPPAFYRYALLALHFPLYFCCIYVYVYVYVYVYIYFVVVVVSVLGAIMMIM